MSDFEAVVRTDYGHTIGLNDDGELWFNACCDGDRTQLDVEQAIELRDVVNAFLSKNGVHRS